MPLRPHHNYVQGRSEEVIYHGSHFNYRVRTKGHVLTVLLPIGALQLDARPLAWGEAVWISWDADDGHMLEDYDDRDARQNVW